MGNSGRIETRDTLPAWVQTLGAMIDRGTEVRVMCEKCRAWQQVDIPALAAKVGRGYSLIDRRCRCRMTAGCRGWNKFAYLTAVYRPLCTDEARYRWMGMPDAALVLRGKA